METLDPVNASVIQYLEANGFRNAAEALKKEVKVAAASEIASVVDRDSGAFANLIKFYNHDESYPKRYEDSYVAFKEWADQSLDVFKADLHAVLYPLYIHCYLDLIERGHSIEASRFLKAHRSDHSLQNASDIDRLEKIYNAELMKEDKFAAAYRENKIQIHMSNYAFELLVSFLHEKKFMLLLAILNMRVRVKVTPGIPKRKEAAGVTEVTARSLISDADENLLSNEEIDLRWSLNPKQAGYAGLKIDSKLPAPIALTPLPVLSQSEEGRVLDEVRKRVVLGADKKPSIAFFTIFNSNQRVNRIGLNRDSSLVAAGMSTSIIKLFDLNRDDSKWTDITERYYDSDGRTELYKPSKRSAYEVELIGHNAPVFGLSFSPDDHFLLSASADTTVRMWSMATKSPVVVYRGHSHPVWDVQFSPLGYYFATASNDRTARLWTTNQVHPVRIFVGHLSDVNCVRFHPNCNYIFTGSSDKTIRMWDVNSGETVRLFTGHSGPVYTIAVSPDGRFIASSGEDKDISIWDLKTSRRIALAKGHTAPVWTLDFSGDGALLASGSLDKTVRLWDMQGLVGDLESNPELADVEKTPLASYPTKKTPVLNVQFTRMNLLLAAGRFDRLPGDRDNEEEEPMVDQPTA